MQLEWEITDNKAFEQKITELTNSNLISQILANRGIDTYQKAKLFLNPTTYPFSNPKNFLDISKAVERIKQAIEKKQNIVICGDFDCDGVTSTAILYKTLVLIGAKVGCYIPHRVNENHGLNSKAIIEIISKQQAKLIITVDNGIANVSEIKLAKSLGTDVIITDHHDIPAEIPPAYAIINPKYSQTVDKTLSFAQIENMVNFAGVMVCYKLCCELLDVFNKSNKKEELIPYVALGTISDVMPLTNENRAIVVLGLKILKEKMPKWLSKIFELSQRNSENIESETLAFLVAPRINAAGRLEKATTALEMLVSEDNEKVDFCANQLHQFNQTRQQLCETSFKEASIRIHNEINLKTSKAIVLADEKWHIGIVGLLASKIVETYNRPAFIMNINKQENVARCSIRGIKGLNVYKVLSQMDECFLNYGGHELAGGFGVDLTKYSIKEITSRINKIVLTELDGNSLTSKINIDMILQPEDLTVDFIEKLSLLEPYGEGNKPCLFGMENLALKKLDLIGNNSHLKMLFEAENGNVFEGLIWNKNEHPIELLDKVDLTFIPKINEFKGNKTIQLIVKNIYIKNRKIEKNDISFDANEKNQIVLVDHRKKTNFYKMLNSYLSNNNANVFVEDKVVENILDDYPFIKTKMKNRYNIEESPELIILSTPCDENVFSEIIAKSSSQKIHIFNSNDKKIDVHSFIKTLSGMLKYCSSHNENKMDIEKSLSYLSVNTETFIKGIELLHDFNVIQIVNIEDGIVLFEFIESRALIDIIQAKKYKELLAEIERINSFKENFKNASILEIRDMIDIY